MNGPRGSLTANLFSYLRQVGGTNAVLEGIAGIVDGLISETLRYGPRAAYALFQTAADGIVTRYGGEGMEAFKKQ